MSDAKEPVAREAGRGILLAMCTQCDRECRVEAARHALPCGHIMCLSCIAQLRHRRGVCCVAECAGEPDFSEEWPLALCVGRATRNARLLARRLCDQGDVGDKASLSVTSAGEAASSSESSDDPWGLCLTHAKPLSIVALPSRKQFCEDCPEKEVLEVGSANDGEKKAQSQSLVPVASALATLLASSHSEADAARPEAPGAEVDRAGSRLARETVRVFDFPVREAHLTRELAEWKARETARVQAWSKREGPVTSGPANACVALIEQVHTRRLNFVLGALTQRLSLQVTLEEFERELSDLPRALGHRAAKQYLLTVERERLLAELAARRLRILPAVMFESWRHLPALETLDPHSVYSVGVSDEFEPDGVELSMAEAMATLRACKESVIPLNAYAWVPGRLPPVVSSRGEKPARSERSSSELIFCRAHIPPPTHRRLSFFLPHRTHLPGRRAVLACHATQYHSLRSAATASSSGQV